MKLKKISMSFICYLIVAAFTGIISVEISSGFIARHQKTEISTDKKDLGSGINFVLEEERYSDDVLSANMLLPVRLDFNTALPADFRTLSAGFLSVDRFFMLLKDPLFIHIRALRI